MCSSYLIIEYLFKVCIDPGGRGGTLIFHTYVGLGHFLGVQNFEFQYFSFLFFFGGGGGSKK